MEDKLDFIVQTNAQQVVNNNQLGSAFSVGPIQAHIHNGTDAPKVSVQNLTGFYNPIITYAPVAAATAIIDLTQSNVNHITMPAGNITLAVSGQRSGQCFIVRILQDSSGSRTVTWFSTIKWAGGSPPTLTTTANKADTFGFEITSILSTGVATYDGFIIGQNI